MIFDGWSFYNDLEGLSGAISLKSLFSAAKQFYVIIVRSGTIASLLDLA